MISGSERRSSITERLATGVWARDLLGVDGCTEGAGCLRAVDWFRSGLQQKETQKLYRGFTVRRLADLGEEAFHLRHYSIAGIDLARYASPDQLLEKARTTTSRTGRVNREVNKALRFGYFTDVFDVARYAPDMTAVHTSKAVRGGKLLKESYKATADDLRASAIEPAGERCPVHRRWFWGVFQDDPGHRQDGLVTDARLVAYLYLIRSGNFLFYGRIMGHGDHLRNGVMYLLHFSFLESLMSEERHGLRFVFYNAFHSGPKDGSLTKWKQRCLFEPRYLLYAEPGVRAWFEVQESLPTLIRRRSQYPIS